MHIVIHTYICSHQIQAVPAGFYDVGDERVNSKNVHVGKDMYLYMCIYNHLYKYI
jgi:hypothetical protein